jgi:4-aminobutyrate aminotransferase / (S)-3-amino-2-methylpropionate transaminase / 5-aminovalerate transaminase
METMMLNRLEKRAVPGPKSAALLEKSRIYEPPCAADQVPVVWDHGERVWVTDVDGNRYIDFTSGVLVTNVGHCHPGLVKAVQDQAARLMNCYSFPTPERVTAAERLVKTFPPNLDKVFFLSTGAEATEAALRVARRYTGKQEVLGFYGGFHGRTYGVMGIAGSVGTRRQFGVPVPGGVMAPYAYCYRCFYDKRYPDCDMYCLKQLDRVIASSSSGDMGAVMVEPYQGTAGFIFPPEGWLKRLETWARERDLVLIIDEVQSSFGRTGKLYAIEWEDVRPQMICLGKGLGSGVATSALGGESKVLECMEAGELSSTWGGNPLSSAAALAVMEVMEEEQLPQRAALIGASVKVRFLEMQKRYRFLGDVRGKGLVMGLEFVDPADGYTPSQEITRRVIMQAAQNGLLLGKLGLYGNVIRIAPPLVITQEEADLALDILDQVFGEIAKA